ncbi:MAG: trypsin-like peptidase domain-containing protein [Saprospiraceae bacterium]|nr:trypsin-like peptidase domain-containing protein [Saprospiraceae bacterium]
MKNVIDTYKNIVIQIATPLSTGTGFYLEKEQLIVTNEHVIRGNRKVVIGGNSFSKQLAEVLYTDAKYDLAFLEAPKGIDLPKVDLETNSTLIEGDIVVAVGHPFNLRYTATQGIVSNVGHQHDELRYIQHDAALNPGNSGGPLINARGKIEGINTFIIKDGNSIGFSLPVSYLREAIDEYSKHFGKKATRCTSCANIVFEHTLEGKYCPHCGVKLILPNQVEEYEPIGTTKIIEEMLIQLGISVELSRRGPNMWQIRNGSAKINIYYHENIGIVKGDAYLCKLPKSNIKEIYEYLLRQNYSNRGLTLSVKGQDLVLSLIIFDRYLNKETSKVLFRNLIEKADYYDDQLIHNFSTIPFSDI